MNPIRDFRFWLIVAAWNLLATLAVVLTEAFREEAPVPIETVVKPRSMAHTATIATVAPRSNLQIVNDGPRASVVTIRRADGSNAIVAQIYCPVGQSTWVQDVSSPWDVYAIASADSSISLRVVR